ncbi:MAG: DNA ligase [Pseudomonadota bacterium]|nr:DNA ligase [Pseudomonadota bacterium]MDP1905995.1 DNA ligase [Pseudomonadota bacterium]MDP2352445.1 DNA ligase [Pseudomonadota bacterium]
MRSMNIWANSLLLACLLLAPLPALAELPTLAHAETYRAGIDPTGYWVSEKLDGVRAVWDGEQLHFRSGRLIAAPSWFTQRFPARALDGELWMGRGQFERLSGVVRCETPDDAEWRQVRYMLFELPGAEGDFSERVTAMREIAAQAGLPWLQAVDQVRFADQAALQRRFDEVVKGGGEGLMLHRADAPYRAGRSDDLLKLKPWDDAEAVVVAHLPGKGKYAGKLGALLVELPDGRRLRIGSGFSDVQRTDPPAVGATITYRYRGLTATGLPRFATFLRAREAF